MNQQAFPTRVVQSHGNPTDGNMLFMFNGVDLLVLFALLVTFVKPSGIGIFDLYRCRVTYLHVVKERIDAAGYYVDIDSSDRTIQKKVREAQLAQYNYMMEMLFKLTKKIKKKNKLSTH
ncbi:threonine--tRNA ligase, mitochondrial 1-like protein [Tanacetum coccineum]